MTPFMKIIPFPRKIDRAVRRLKVLTRIEFDTLDKADPDGVYDRNTRENLYWTLEKLGEHFKKCSKDEKEIYKRFKNAYFGIRIPEGTVWKGNIDHPGSVIILGRFEGNIHSGKTVTILRTGSVVGEVFADQGQTPLPAKGFHGQSCIEFPEFTLFEAGLKI